MKTNTILTNCIQALDGELQAIGIDYPKSYGLYKGNQVAKANTGVPGSKTIETKDELQKAMVLMRSRHQRLDVPNLLRLAQGIPIPGEVRYLSMARIPESSVEIARNILGRFSLNSTGVLHCYESLDARGFQHLSVPRLRKTFGASAQTIGRSIRTLRRAGIIDTRQDGARGLMIRLNPLMLADWADKLAERKRAVRGRRWH